LVARRIGVSSWSGNRSAGSSRDGQHTNDDRRRNKHRRQVSDAFPSTGRAVGGRGAEAAASDRGGRGGGGSIFDSRSHIRLIIQAVEQIREGVGPDGNWMIDPTRSSILTKPWKSVASRNRRGRSASRPGSRRAVHRQRVAGFRLRRRTNVAARRLGHAGRTWRTAWTGCHLTRRQQQLGPADPQRAPAPGAPHRRLKTDDSRSGMGTGMWSIGFLLRLDSNQKQRKE
jgi:hypothetical protein